MNKPSLKPFRSLLILLLISLNSCSFFNKEEVKENAVAKVGDQYLYKEDLPEYFQEIKGSADSITLVTNFINNWAVSQLLMQKAKINLPDEKVRSFEKLVSNYKADLYTLAYKEALMKQALDTIITNQQLVDFYQNNKENFKLNESLVKLRYIELPLNYSEKNSVAQKLKRYEEKDSLFLDSIAVQFKNYSFSADTWYKKSVVVKKIPVIDEKNERQFLKKSQFVELKDSIGVYLVDIKAVLERNEVAPMSFVTSTIKQILLNRKKLEYLQQIEKDILKEAIDKKEFELYE